MASKTITFNQPGIKIFMGDEKDFIRTSDNDLTIDIRNTGENYIVVPAVYNVQGRNGEHPSGNSSGNYLSSSDASTARTSLINSAYSGQEFAQVVSQYLSGATTENSTIFDQYGSSVQQQLLYIYEGEANAYTYTGESGEVAPDSSDDKWPSAVNSEGFWLSTFSSPKTTTTDMSWHKLTDFYTYYDYYCAFTKKYGNDYYSTMSKSDWLNIISNNNLSGSQLYTAINSKTYDYVDRVSVCLCYVIYPTVTVENVSITSSGAGNRITADRISILYNGSVPSQVIYLASEPENSHLTNWSALKIVANSKTDTSSGRTESVIIVEPKYVRT